MTSFFQSVIQELKKLTLPTKKETYITTATIIIATFIATLIVMSTDFIILQIVQLLLN